MMLMRGGWTREIGETGDDWMWHPSIEGTDPGGSRPPGQKKKITKGRLTSGSDRSHLVVVMGAGDQTNRS